MVWLSRFDAYLFARGEDLLGPNLFSFSTFFFASSTFSPRNHFEIMICVVLGERNGSPLEDFARV